ncbi:hypothetical protein [Citrobacter sp. JGM124]|uniref:hypothetical protein n=1 Tax=Citrobacter sp. JGM124 TaxID=2799789 RepID=UPI001BA81520|nr:hypothetical protein [Citrobacter sp. JGM124]MBS0849577.1 hypothetical protein [Citrobacter sp. JGM124]
MYLKSLFIVSVLFLTACSSNTVTRTADKPVVQYARENSTIVPVNSIESTSNSCVDNFNFLRRAGDSQYERLSSNYIKVNDGFHFLRVNKNIMGEDAKRIYTMNLNMKLDTICSEVNYASYQLIQKKIKDLSNI